MIRIDEKRNCCGCGACAQVCPMDCIRMEADKEGFLYPFIDKEKCVDCGLCDKTCPITNKMPEIQKTQTAYVVQHKNKEILKESTSGGAFTAIAEHIIDESGVVFGAAFDADFKVTHTYTEKYDDIGKFRNSKYVQSDTAQTFREARKFLEDGRLVCYSGTPCQIEGLRHYLGKDYDNLITVDIVCRAVPSPLIWEKYKRYIANGDKAVQAAFRSKEPFGYDYSQMSIKTSRLFYHAGVESDAYLRAFFSNLSDRPSCYSCAFKKRYRESDITLWDCFEADNFDKCLDNNMGATRVLIHSPKGQVTFDKVLDKIQYTAVQPNKLVLGVREMFYSVPDNPRRDEFFRDAEAMDDKEFFEKYFPDTLRVKAERVIRYAAQRLGIYRPVKRMTKGFLKLVSGKEM